MFSESPLILRHLPRCLGHSRPLVGDRLRLMQGKYLVPFWGEVFAFIRTQNKRHASQCVVSHHHPEVINRVLHAQHPAADHPLALSEVLDLQGGAVGIRWASHSMRSQKPPQKPPATHSAFTRANVRTYTVRTAGLPHPKLTCHVETCTTLHAIHQRDAPHKQKQRKGKRNK